MSTNNRIGRNPFNKKPAPVENIKASPQIDAKIAESEEQLIGELIDLPEENWQPLTVVPTQFIKQLFSRWI